MHVVRTSVGKFTQTGGRTAMVGLLEATHNLKHICAVWSHNDDMLLGAIGAMQQAGVRPGKDVLTVSVDGVSGIYRAMLTGEVNASVEVRSDIGGNIFDVVQGYLGGRRDYPKWILIPTDLHTPDDAAKMLARAVPS